MKPATEEAATEVATPPTVFVFDDKGFCTNPEIVSVACPDGFTCAVYLAEHEGKWLSGFSFAGKGVKMQRLSVNNASGALCWDARDAALNETLIELCDDLLTVGDKAAPLLSALRGYRAQLAHQVITGTLPGIDVTAPGVAPLTVDQLAHDLAASGLPAPIAPRTYRTSFADLPLWAVQRNPENHRKHFDAGKLAELADSIRLEGLHQPIAVRRLLPGETPVAELSLGQDVAPGYELICGERRWRASQLAGVPTISAKIYEDLPRVASHAIALIENLQREGINCMEEAEGYAALMNAENLTQEQCAERIGRARSSIANCLRLLKLPEQIRELLRDGKLTLAHGIALARFSDYPKHLAVIIEEAFRDDELPPSSHFERGIPFLWSLRRAELIVEISGYGEEKITPALKKHPAYFSTGDGDYVCFEPAHWAAELKARLEVKKAKEEKDRLAREAEVAKAAKKGKKQLVLSDLNREDYTEFQGVHTALNSLVPDDKKAIAKGYKGAKSTIVTDTVLAERLKNAMQRAIKKNRRGALVSIEEKVRKKIASLKKIGPREFAWLVYLITEIEGRQVNLHLDIGAAKAAGVKLPKGVGYSPDSDEMEDYDDEDNLEAGRQVGVLARLAKCDQVALVKTLIAERLPTALTDIVEHGTDSAGAQVIRWFLDSDTLWLLEETDEGRDELIESVKKSPVVAKALAGQSAEEDEE